MPKLLAFLPCEKVLEDKSTNNISLISIMQDMTVQLPSESLPLPKNALAPTQWTIFAMWSREPEEQEAFDVKATLVAPGEETIVETLPTPVTFQDFTVNSQRILMNVIGFPIGVAGKLEILLFTKQQDQSEFVEIARFPMSVTHQATDNPSANVVKSSSLSSSAK